MTTVRRPGTAAVAAGVLAAAVPGAALAAPAAADPRAMTAARAAGAAAAPLDARDFDLRRGTDRSGTVRALGGVLRRTGVAALLRSPGHTGLGGGCGRAAGVPAGSLVYCFDTADSTTRDWVPQGVTSVSDAAAGEGWAGGVRPILVSWHNGGRVRLTFVDPDRRVYRHVLLVAPVMRGGRPTYTDVGVHAGGIAWYGDKLYVADTRHGLREFDMRQIFDLSASRAGSTRRPDRIGLHGGTYYAHGFRYVMAQTGSRHFARGRVGGKCRGGGPLRMSWTAVDRTTWPHVLIAGEYCRPDWPRGRVVSWPLASLAGGGTASADGGARLPVDRVQGAVRTHGRWWFTQSRSGERGRLFSTRYTGTGWAPVRRRTISYGPEDLSCHRGLHRIFTLAEHPGRRALWAFRASSCS
ncbi:hypothetical protein BKA00_007149 [Actinomadura coerulea]|uniref:Secreted protein n=1 Tax=Actinomadura coerulea TaxID=46159 RepID=A0A7X0G670_9ACTN|nr:hypothetical protein [Actinomadura coerulea]MBB6400235.1 hypothetical protein [Actinomadura coerulea]GGQ42883.1 hypothetical protein GCM10010187_71710 [Actinomadura coerulea]